MLVSDRQPEIKIGIRAWRPKVTDELWAFPHQFAGRLERNSGSLLFVFSLLYLLGTGYIASRKFLWADEVLTSYMARLSVANLWPAFASGVDIEPPLFHLITRAFTSVFGQSPLSLRMPAILGGWLMCTSLYVFISRRFKPIYAAIALLIPFVTGAATYMSEARCYGIGLGFSGLALVCWQSAAERRHRKLCLAGLALSLGAAIACQYYLVLVLLAIGAGEVVRSLAEKRIDRPMWVALAGSGLVLVLHLPLIRVAMTFSGGEWSVANARALLVAYQTFLNRVVVPGLVIVVGLAVLGRTTPSADTPAQATRKGELRSWELAAAVVLAGSLAGAFVVAKFTNGIFTLRYGLCMIFGIAIIAVLVIRRYDTGRPLAGALTFLVLLTGFLGHQVIPRQPRFHTPDLLARADSSSAIVIENPLDFLELTYNAPPQLASRLYYLASRKDSIRYTGTDDDDRGLLLLGRWFPLQAEPPSAFLKHHPRLLIWRGNREQRWLLRKLADAGATITLAANRPGEKLFFADVRSGGL